MRVVSKRRLASTTIGIILSVAIIFSIFTLGNNLSKADLYDTLEKSQYHISLSAYIQTDKYDRIVDGISNLPHVERVDTIVTEGISIDTDVGMIPINLGYFRNMQNAAKVVSGRMPTNTNEIAVSSQLVDEYNISVGEYLNGSATNDSGKQINFTLHVVGIFIPQNGELWGMLEALTPFSTLEKFDYVDMYGGVRVDVNYLMSSPDMNAINKKLSTIAGEIENVIGQYSDYVSVQSQMNYYPSMPYALMFLGFSLPIIAMGAYLSKVGIEIELNERRREFGIMRIRGASKFQRFKLLLYESIIYSIIGGIGGYILGEFMAYLANLGLMHLPFFQMDWGWEYAISSIITALFFFFVALYKPWKKMSSLPIIELISHYTQSFKSIEYSPLKDTIKAAFLWGYIITGIYVLQNVSFNGGFNLLVLVAIIILFTLSFLFPIILIFLPLYMTRILTLGTQKLYVHIASAFARISGVAGELVKKGVSRNPKNIAYIAFILAFILTFSSFISATYDNALFSNEIRGVQSAGGDFLVQDFVSTLPKDYLAHSKNVSSFVWLYEDYSASVYNEAVETLYCDFDNYSRTVYHLDVFIKEGSFKKGGVVINDVLAKKYDLHVGDNVQIFLPDIGYRSYRIGSVVYSFPGNANEGDNPTVMFNERVSPENASFIILRAKNYDALKKELDEKGFTYLERKDEQNDHTSVFLSVIDIFMILLGGATIFVIQYSLYFNRRGEIALYKVRGATRGQVSSILMVEGGTVIIISIIVGVSIGLALAYTFTVLNYTTTHLPPFFILGYNFTVVTLIMSLVFLAMQYVISLMFARVKQSEIIRSLGGEM